MTNRFKNILRNARATAPRVIGFALVVFILYGTTVQAAHGHGRLAGPTTHETFSIGDKGFDTNRTTKLGCSDCLICQLHQGFSTTLISVKSDLKPSSQRSKLYAPTLNLTRSEATAPRTGRAPPKTN